MVLAAVERAGNELQAALAAQAWSLSPEDLTEALTATHTLRQQLTGLLARLVREADGRGVPTAEGAASVPVWLRQRLRMGIHEAKRLADLAQVSDARPGLAAALAAGEISAEQARVIGAALAALPDDTEAEVVAEAQRMLIGYAGQFEPVVLRRLGGRILQHVDPAAADAAEAAALARAEARARRSRAFTLTDTGDGRVRLTGWLGHEAAATVAAAIDPLCRPLPEDIRTPTQRRADALTDVCRLALSTGELPVNGGDRPQLVVTVPLTTLTTGLGTAHLDNGGRLTATQTRRLACDAQIIPAVLGGDGRCSMSASHGDCSPQLCAARWCYATAAAPSPTVIVQPGGATWSCFGFTDTATVVFDGHGEVSR